MLEGEGLKLAPKSAITCSSMQDAKAIVRELKRRGVAVQCASRLTYLGVDMSCVKRLVRATRNQRMITTKKQHGRLRKYASASRRFRVLKKIELARPQAGARYGHQVLGLPDTVLLDLRRRLGAVSGHRRGRCLTTLLDLRAPGADPGHALPR
eukprot:814546-Pyramimonas_sp.AAC.1